MNIYAQPCEERFQEYLEYVSEDKKEKILRYRHMEDALRSLYGEILIRDFIVREYSIQNADIKFAEKVDGKPCIKSPEGVKYNISHSDAWVVCAIGSREIGIDIEKIRSVKTDIIKRSLTKTEYESFLNKSPEDQIDYFFDLWTLKESYIKYMGEGLSIPLDSFYFTKNEDEIKIIRSEEKPLYFRQYFFDKNYKFSICSDADCFPAKIEQIDLGNVCLLK